MLRLQVRAYHDAFGSDVVFLEKGSGFQLLLMGTAVRRQFKRIEKISRNTDVSCSSCHHCCFHGNETVLFSFSSAVLGYYNDDRQDGIAIKCVRSTAATFFKGLYDVCDS